MYRPRIAVFGLRNSGKSSLINALTGQQVAIVSDLAGTTTDPVKKTMEISGAGPVVFIDTAGIDDSGGLGAQRVAASKAVIKEADLGLLLFTHNTINETVREWAEACNRASLPVIWVHHKSDLCPLDPQIAGELSRDYHTEVCSCSARDGTGIEDLLTCIQKKLKSSVYSPKSLLGRLINKDQTVVLVCPIDSEAPEGRLILPQVQTIRDVLDNQALALVLTEASFKDYMQKGLPADLIITDSQLFGWVEKWVPPALPLTSFSVLLAHYKGLFIQFLAGTPVLSRLQDGDQVLVLESCSHQVGCEDIGRVKLPNRIRSFTGKDIRFTIVAGLDPLPERTDVFALAIQCGGCMVTQRQLQARVADLLDQHIPISNYGMALAYMSGIFERAVAPFTKEIF